MSSDVEQQSSQVAFKEGQEFANAEMDRFTAKVEERKQQEAAKAEASQAEADRKWKERQEKQKAGV